MTSSDLASRIDHTLLKPEASTAEIHRLVTETIHHNFASVCVAPVFVARVARMLRAESARMPCCTVIAFPHGTSKSTVKAIEATSAIKDGAGEIDVVAHLPYLLNADVDAARAELMEIVRAARATRRDVVIKVIVESALLMSDPARAEERVAAACRSVRESGCDFIKTSTGFHPAGGATPDAVRLMKKHGNDIRIKAAGGIRDLKTALALLEAGADRLGISARAASSIPSAAVAILEELARMK
jgi:deoxyribose-phosphate aldolase